MDHLLPPDDHRSVTDHRVHCRSLPYISLEARPKRSRTQGFSEAPPEGKAGKGVPWPIWHALLCKQSGQQEWWVASVPNKEMQDLLPTLRAFTPREFDLLHHWFRVVHIGISESKRRLLNTGQTIGRGMEAEYHIFNMTVTARMRVYITDKCRFLRGLEALALQGIHYQKPDLQEILAGGEFSHSLLINLAGNAFHAWCCVAVVIVTIRLRVEICHRSQFVADRFFECAFGQ